MIHRETDGNPLFVATLRDEVLSQLLVRRIDETWQLDASIEQVAAVRPSGLPACSSQLSFQCLRN